MNLQALSVGAIAAVNPQTQLSIQVSTGSTNVNGDLTPTYAAPVSVSGQIQPLSTADIRHMDALNIQGVRRRVYINGQVNGLVRATNQGGDLITTPDGKVWLTTEVIEAWPDWCCFFITLQDGS